MNFIRVALYCLIGGLSITWAAMGTGHFGTWWLAGILFSAAFVPVALFGPRGWFGQFRVIFPAFMMVSVVCLWSEALIFVQAPEIQQHPLQNLIAPAALYTILAIVLATLALILKLHREDGPAVEVRPAGKMALLVLLCGVAYAFYYLVFGAITYQFFTKSYYPDAPAQVAKIGLWFWAIQIGRGVLMTLAVVPVIRTLRMSRLQAAIAVGLLVWLIGGAAPLTLPNPYMSGTQRFIHIIEIFTQNAALGFTAGMLLRRKQTHPAVDMPTALPARA